jgi:hypothetical protein
MVEIHKNMTNSLLKVNDQNVLKAKDQLVKKLDEMG